MSKEKRGRMKTFFLLFFIKALAPKHFAFREKIYNEKWKAAK